MFHPGSRTKSNAELIEWRKLPPLFTSPAKQIAPAAHFGVLSGRFIGAVKTFCDKAAVQLNSAIASATNGLIRLSLPPRVVPASGYGKPLESKPDHRNWSCPDRRQSGIWSVHYHVAEKRQDFIGSVGRISTRWRTHVRGPTLWVLALEKALTVHVSGAIYHHSRRTPVYYLNARNPITGK
jgi:hypothetical protein